MTDRAAIVVGGGIGGLQAAHTFAKAGLSPLLLEARGTAGGLVFGAPIGGVWVDLGAESFAKRSREVMDLCTELGLDTVDPAGSSWIWSHRRRPGSGQSDPDGQPGHALPIPHGILGIPTSLDDPVVAAALSPVGLERARQDLTMGPLPGADAMDLASIVETRLGVEVLDRLVDPIAGGIHSTHPSRLQIDIVTPGLREALARVGSLVGAAAQLRAAAPTGSVVAAPAGGMFTLPRAMCARIDQLGGEVATNRVVTAIDRDGDAWRVTYYAAERAAHPADPPVPVGPPITETTTRLVVALDGRAALDLLRGVDHTAVGDWSLPRGADLVQVCIALADDRLDAGPRGSGLLVTPHLEGESPRVTCKALTHYSYKWPLVVANSGLHVLRISYGRAGVPTPEPTLSGALADASVLLGIDLAVSSLAGHAVIHFPNSLPPQSPAHRTRVCALNNWLATQPGLGITGAWFAGTGLAAVVPHATLIAEGLR